MILVKLVLILVNDSLDIIMALSHVQVLRSLSQR